MTPAERFIKIYTRTTILEELTQGIMAAGGGVVVLIAGGELFVKYSPLLFGKQAQHYDFCILPAALFVTLFIKFLLSWIARRNRGFRATLILNMLSTPGSRVLVNHDRYVIQPFEEKLSRHEFEVFKATIEGELDSTVVIPPRLPSDPMTLLKNAFYLLLISGVTYYLWEKSKTPAPEPEVAVVAATPEPTPVPTPAPTVKAKHLAPEGVYYLLTRVSISTDSGVVGIPVGTKVTLIKRGYAMRVTDGEHEFEVSSSQLTNDLDIKARVAGTQVY